MNLVIDVLVSVIQVALFAFLLWGASLCLRDLLARPRAPQQASDMPEVAMAQQASFERAASLVLLALLCTTLAGLPGWS
jgi:hypothetical protein